MKDTQVTHDERINLVSFANALLAPPLKQGVNKSEHIALRQIEVTAYPFPDLQKPTEEQMYSRGYTWAIRDLSSLERAAATNHKLSQSEYDRGRLEGIKACVARLEERKI